MTLEIFRKEKMMQVLNPQSMPSGFNIAIVISRFNEGITQKLYDGAVERLKELHFKPEQITFVWVPGAVEVPLAAQRLAKTKQFEAIICYGAVIMGETKHFEYVCQQVSQGCQQVALTHNIPVIFGILTVETEEQAHERTGGAHGHLGRIHIDNACEFVSVLRQIEGKK
jgi:6,7-dimethyl-8-ribityllumazine synthase